MTPTDGRGAPPGHPAPPSSSAVARLRLIVARLYRQLAQASGDDLNLTYAQLSALARVQEYGPLRLGELAAREQVAAPTLTRTLRPLAAAGLLSKEPDPLDGRSLLVSITADGEDLLVRIRRERSELLARRMARLTAEQTSTLMAALPVLEQLLTEPEPRPEQDAHPEEAPPAPPAEG
ncbi:MarR family winged helix-turn-helix transcriptional regulator [Actinacidiphila acidipaludis]|uniref:MarR family transcriptional regulator n=1 Tax=Actinacidiphila acidipaludis TaxID=2873382 RepID=A0ABS7Q6I6_9ACTN|nr:MarR family transcriptional regulator [Streptomyces acidipaludis]MBY8878758.1 MarR family transcriptional regulator [Streptomyces acidipaludis]